MEITFVGIRRLQSAPFSSKSLTTLISPAATAKHKAGYGMHDKDGSAPRRSKSSIIALNSCKLKILTQILEFRKINKFKVN